jgi:hypothetical protein
MPERFPYPTQGWSTGNMRMAKREMKGPSGKEFQELEGLRKEKTDRLSQASPQGQGQYPMLSTEEWKSWIETPIDPAYPKVSAHKKDRDPLMELLQRGPPEGLVVSKEHPELNKIGDDYEIFNIPDREDDLFVRKKKDVPMTSEGPPISGAA